VEIPTEIPTVEIPTEIPTVETPTDVDKQEEKELFLFGQPTHNIAIL